jgi:glycosyltransferase involved in cell wall biosynthesis
MFSLIVSTVNRVTELERLLASLDAQTCRDFEVLIVDQNSDNRVVPVLQAHKQLRIQRLRSLPGISRARNVGLRASKGDIIAFPDDDCWYPAELLATVRKWFLANPQFDLLLGSLRTAEDEPMQPRWPSPPGPCDKQSLWDCAASVSAFLRCQVTTAVGDFNENVGVGAPTKYQSSEEIDYSLRALAAGFHACYDPTIFVRHPKMQSIDRLRATTMGYALGIGYVARSHHYSWRFLAKLLIRSLAGAALHLCKGEIAWAHVYLLRACGQFKGYIFYSDHPEHLQSKAD